MEIKKREAVVDDLSHDGRGVLKLDGKVYFVQGALPGERIEFEPFRKRRGQFTGRLLSVLSASPHRVQPACEYFGTCGGCTLQHFAPDQQLAHKEKTLLGNLSRIGRVEPENLLPALSGENWHYRRKARPGVKYVPKKGGVLVGFRELGNSYLTSLRQCKTLERRLSDLLDPLHQVIAQTSIFQQVPQLEFAAGDNATAVVLRHMQPLNPRDLDLLTKFAQHHQVQLFLQSGGLDTIKPLWPEVPIPLYYLLPDFDLSIEFSPSDFIQVNGTINQSLIQQAIDLLDLKAPDCVLDLFCGLGNFTLPVAKSGVTVTGVEGEQGLVQKGRANAAKNNLDNVKFVELNLYGESILKLGSSNYNKLLLDPPRSGADEVVKYLVPKIRPQKIVYVSCNPATLARDAETLVHHHGYRFTHAGAIDMFPHTAHIESMGVFESGDA